MMRNRAPGLSLQIHVEASRHMNKLLIRDNQAMLLWRKRKKRKVADLKQGLLILVENLGFIGLRNHWGGSVLS